MKGKKIALLLFNYFPFGGLQKDFYSIATELEIRGYELTIYTGKWEGENPKNFKVIQLGITGISNHQRNVNFYNKIQKELEEREADIVFGFNKMPGLDFYFAADTCFKLKNRGPESFLYRLMPRYRKSVEYEEAVFGLDSKTHIFSLNKKQKEEFIDEYKTQQDRLQIVPPGISKDWVQLKRRNIRDELGLSREANLILFVGSDFKRKGLDRAIDALKFLDNQSFDSYLLVAGQDDKRAYLNKIESLNLGDRVIFLGPVEDVNTLMLEATLLIHPAREEAAGNVIAEAIVSSLPILTCESVGFASLVLEFNSGYVLEGDFDQDSFNNLLHNLLSTEKNSEIKEGMQKLNENKYFYSRFTYIADSIDSYFDE